jgi:hypothetical protein
MTEKIAPYRIDNVTHVPMPQKPLSTGPGNTAARYGAAPFQEPLAEVLPLIAPPKKDASKP